MALLDWNMFLERVEHNEALAIELGRDLITSLDGRIETLEYAITQGEFKRIEHAAHALRGLVAPYGCRELLAILKRIEEESRGGIFECALPPLEIKQMAAVLKEEIAARIECLGRGDDAPGLCVIPIEARQPRDQSLN